MRAGSLMIVCFVLLVVPSCSPTSVATRSGTTGPTNILRSADALQDYQARNPVARSEAAQALRYSHDPSAIHALRTSLLREPVSGVAFDIAVSLAYVEDLYYAEEYLNGRKFSPPELCRIVDTLLGQSSQIGFDALKRLALEEDARVRAKSYDALFRYRHPGAQVFLISLPEDPHAEANYRLRRWRSEIAKLRESRQK